jgi:hypothetical protein
MNNRGIIEKETARKGLSQFLLDLDEKSRAILDYLWWHRHAEISELRNIDETLGDSEILYRLKEIINRKSQNYWGKPLVSFEQSKVDPISDEIILFSWWYMDDEDVLITDSDKALVDVFNESDNVILIAQLPASINLSAPDIQFKNGILRVKFKKTSIN